MWCGSHICIICSTIQQKLIAQRRLGIFFLLILGKKPSFVLVPTVPQENLEVSPVEKNTEDCYHRQTRNPTGEK